MINIERNSKMVSWCSWLSRQSNTLKVSGSNPGEAIILFDSLCLKILLTLSFFNLLLTLSSRDRGKKKESTHNNVLEWEEKENYLVKLHIYPFIVNVTCFKKIY